MYHKTDRIVVQFGWILLHMGMSDVILQIYPEILSFRSPANFVFIETIGWLK